MSIIYHGLTCDEKVDTFVFFFLDLPRLRYSTVAILVSAKHLIRLTKESNFSKHFFTLILRSSKSKLAYIKLFVYLTSSQKTERRRALT